MKEILITSSVLILAVVGLRLLFQKKVSRRLIYCAWLLVALRLLVPVQFGNVNFSILTPAQPVTDAIGQVAQTPVAGPSREEVYDSALRDYMTQERPIFRPEVQEQVDTQLQQGRPVEEVYGEVLESNAPENILLPEVKEEIETQVAEIVKPTLGQIATVIWVIGMVAMAAWFVGVNVAFYRKLGRSATDLELPECKTPVKVSSAVASPCLFGLLRPTIYLTPGCVSDERKRHHVLTHELTHLRSGDHIWAWVRCICLCIYWFNPLVWLAAGLSKRDCELACDEAALKQLGEEERLAYGKTLLDMVSSVPAPGQLLQTATAMHETKKQLKERMTCIVKKPKVFLTAAILLLAVLALVTGCAFTGAFNNPQGDDPQTTTPSITTTPPTTTTVEDPAALDELKRLAAEADEMMKEGGIYSFPFPWFWEGAVDPTKANSYMDREGDILIINTDMSKVDYGMVGYESFYKGVRYDLFLGLLSQEYGDCITEGECDYKPEYSHVQSYYVFFCPTYKEEGFSTIKECWDAVRKGQHTLRSEAYLIDYGYYRPFIQDFQETDYNAKLHDAIFPPVGDPPADLVPLSFPVRDTMRRLATKATRMMEDKNRVTIVDNPFYYFGDTLSQYVTRVDGVIHVDTNVDPENQKGVYKSLRFLLFCSLVLEEYGDCIVEDEWMSLLIYPGYKEDGFATIEDCLTAWKNGEFAFTGEAYSISYYNEEIIMHHYIELFSFDITQFVMKGIETGEDNNTDPTEPTTPPTQPTLSPEEQELAYFNALFANDDPAKHNRYWYATGHTYAAPTELKLHALFDGGFAGESKINDAEREGLSKLVLSPEALLMSDTNRLPKDKMDAELQKVFGISLADLPDSAFEGLYYLESTECYYLIQGGMTSVPAHSQMRTVVHNDDGTVTLTYDLPGGSGAITLKPNGDGWLVVSNIQDMLYG